MYLCVFKILNILAYSKHALFAFYLWISHVKHLLAFPGPPANTCYLCADALCRLPCLLSQGARRRLLDALGEACSPRPTGTAHGGMFAHSSFGNCPQSFDERALFLSAAPLNTSPLFAFIPNK